MTEKLLRGGEYLIQENICEQVFTPEDFSDEHKQFAETTLHFVNDEIVPNIEEIEKQNFDLVVEGLRKCGEIGLLMMDAPEEYGGLELDKVSSMLVGEKIAESGSFSVAYVAHSGIGTLPLIYYGSAEQKDKYLEKIISGEWAAAYCLTEPGSGSDAIGVQASAKLSEDGSHYILNGTKQFITNGGFAQLFTVFAKIDKEHFTGFLIEKDFEGLFIGPEEKKMGIKGSSTTQVILDNCKVPVENVLGEIGKGHKIAFNVLNIGRFKLGAGAVGSAKQALTEGIQYSNERVQFKQKISQFGAIKEKIADITCGIFASESLIYRLAGLLDSRTALIDRENQNYYAEYLKGIEEYAVECAISKVYCTEILAQTVDEVLQIHGGYGFVSEYPIERYYRDERINRIYEGTNEINRLLISGMLLKKAMNGDSSLLDGVQKAHEVFEERKAAIADDGGVFDLEKSLVSDLKLLFQVFAGAAVQKFGMKIHKEQEILMAASDLAMQVFALESSVLRAEKCYNASSDRKKKLLEAVVRVIAFDSIELAGAASRKGAFYIDEEGCSQSMILKAVQQINKYDISGLLQAKRLLAETTCEDEKYLFKMC